MITKGAKVTRSTSAYALPLFLPRPENLKQKAPIPGKNNPAIPFSTPFWTTTFWYRLAPLQILLNIA